MDKSINIPFNKPYLTGKEAHYLYQAVLSGKISGDGLFTKKCHQFFESKYGFKKVLLTTSCTDALELSALLLNIQPGDEVILPSYTFVSTANAFVLRGAKLVFVDSRFDHPGIDESSIEALITSRTKVIVPVHYAGVASDMDKINDLAKKHNLAVVEDAAQAIDAYYFGKNGKTPLGACGDLGCFSFHETKNIMAGEGGMIALNQEKYHGRAEILREKGTNRSSFFRGEVDKYSWVDIGSSFLPSDIIAAFLYAQLENLEDIQLKRLAIWERYFTNLENLEKEGHLKRPFTPEYSSKNGHMFYVVCNSLEERTGLVNYLKERGIYSVFHYLSLHSAPYFIVNHDGRPLSESDRYTDCLLRLPLFYELSLQQIDEISEAIESYFRNR
jgi:dTDP-4-amino-4,6-dideoxygalactose transaminase